MLKDNSLTISNNLTFIMPSKVQIPVVDISSFIEDSTSNAAKQVIEQVRSACTTYGFLQISGHGVSHEIQEEVIRGAKKFFELPMEEKKKIDRALPGAAGRGYEVMRTQQQQKGLGGDFKEVSHSILSMKIYVQMIA